MWRRWFLTSITWWTRSFQLLTARKAYQNINLSLFCLSCSLQVLPAKDGGADRLYTYHKSRTRQLSRVLLLGSRIPFVYLPFPPSLSPEAEVGWKMQETFGYIKRIWFISHSAGISWHNLCSLHRLGAWLVALFLPLHAVPSVVQDCDHQCELPLQRLLVRRQLHPL